MDKNSDDMMDPAPDKCIRRTELRGRIYKLLSDCYSLPDDDVLNRIQELQAILPEVYPDIKTKYTELSAVVHPSTPSAGSDSRTQPHVTEEDLKVEYTRLFLGPFSIPAPPYGSMYLEHTDHLMTESTMHAQRWYESEGMEVDIPEVPDHIRIELEFMYYLVYKEWDCAQDGTLNSGLNTKLNVDTTGKPNNDQTKTKTGQDNSNYKMMTEYRQKQKMFLEQHLVRWIPQFTRKVKDHTQAEYYTELANLTGLFISMDYEQLCCDKPSLASIS